MRTFGIALLIAFAGCHSSSSSSDGAADAAAAAKPKIVRPRVVGSGEMPLDLGLSKLKLTIVKDHVTPVGATLSMRDGALALETPTPNVHLAVDLDTFDSEIAIRNERVRNIFFETSAIGWETAELKVDLPQELVDRVKKEKKVAGVKLDGQLKVHGATSKLPLTVDATYDGARATVKSTSPVEVKVSDLGLTDNLHRLNAICMHDGIDDIVKVDVSLVFASGGH
jgi:hypothetical protein